LGASLAHETAAHQTAEHTVNELHQRIRQLENHNNLLEDRIVQLQREKLPLRSHFTTSDTPPPSPVHERLSEDATEQISQLQKAVSHESRKRRTSELLNEQLGSDLATTRQRLVCKRCYVALLTHFLRLKHRMN